MSKASERAWSSVRLDSLITYRDRAGARERAYEEARNLGHSPSPFISHPITKLRFVSRCERCGATMSDLFAAMMIDPETMLATRCSGATAGTEPAAGRQNA